MAVHTSEFTDASGRYPSQHSPPYQYTKNIRKIYVKVWFAKRVTSLFCHKALMLPTGSMSIISPNCNQNSSAFRKINTMECFRCNIFRIFIRIDFITYFTIYNNNSNPMRSAKKRRIDEHKK